jgi:hypothetical protein
MRKLFIVPIVLSSLLLAACSVTANGPSVSIVRGSGNVTTQTRTVSGFSKLSFSGLGDVTITQGENEGLVMGAEDNLISEITSDVRSGTLYIGFKRQNAQDTVIPTKPITFALAVKSLDTIELSGAGQVRSAGLKSSAMTIKLSGAGNITIDQLTADSVSSTISGAGNVTLAGQAPKQDVTSSGLGSYQAPNLSSSTASIKLTGAGSITVWVSETMDATISGAGTINYYGSPAVTKHITGIGVFKPMGNK